MRFDDNRFEYERLLAMGRTAPKRPSKRLLLVARQLHPYAWSAGADEHIAWGKGYGIVEDTSRFCGQFMLIRRLSLIQAADMLKLLDRLDAGKPELKLFDARDISKKLDKEAWARAPFDPRDRFDHKPSREVFFFKACDGIPEPITELAKDGRVALTWTEDDRTAVVTISGDKTVLATTVSKDIELNLHGYKSDMPLIMTQVTDWIYFGGPTPKFDIAIAA